jgi:hypothetical protein
MPRSSKTNVPDQPLRWSLARASVEFSLSIPTIRAGLNKNSTAAGADNCYSTSEICSAIYGALYMAKIKTQTEQAEKLRIENMVSRAELLNRRELARAFEQVADAISSRIMACSEMPRLVREDLLRDLSRVDLVLQETADKQIRLPRRDKGQVDEVDGSEN